MLDVTNSPMENKTFYECKESCYSAFLENKDMLRENNGQMQLKTYVIFQNKMEGV